MYMYVSMYVCMYVFLESNTSHVISACVIFISMCYMAANMMDVSAKASVVLLI